MLDMAFDRVSNYVTHVLLYVRSSTMVCSPAHLFIERRNEGINELMPTLTSLHFNTLIVKFGHCFKNISF